MSLIWQANIVANVLLLALLLWKRFFLKHQWFCLCILLGALESLPLYRALSNSAYRRVDEAYMMLDILLYVFAIFEGKGSIISWSMGSYLVLNFYGLWLRYTPPYHSHNFFKMLQYVNLLCLMLWIAVTLATRRPNEPSGREEASCPQGTSEAN